MKKLYHADIISNLIFFFPLGLIFPFIKFVLFAFMFSVSIYLIYIPGNNKTKTLTIAYMFLSIPLLLVIFFNSSISDLTLLHSYFSLSFILVFFIYFKNKKRLENVLMIFAIILNLSYTIVTGIYFPRFYNNLNLVLALVYPSNIILLIYIYKEMKKSNTKRIKISFKSYQIYFGIPLLLAFVTLMISIILNKYYMPSAIITCFLLLQCLFLFNLFEIKK